MIRKLKTKSGTYKVWMRARYSHIKSQRALDRMIQEVIAYYKNKPGWEGYAESLQKRLDDRDYMDIASLLGIFNKTIRTGD